jgi:hypothetical protein
MSARLPLALVVWIAAVLAAITLSSAVAGSIHTTGTGSGSGSGSSGSSVDPSTVRSTDPSSLMHTANLTHALATLRGHLGADARLDNFVVYPGYVSATAVRGGTEVDATDFVNGTYSQTSTGGTPGTDRLVPLAKVNPRVPAAFDARLARIAHVPLREIRYMVMMPDPITHQLSWLVYLVPGSHYEYLSAAGGTGPVQAYTPGGSIKQLRG